jgi:hypothetical protein
VFVPFGDDIRRDWRVLLPQQSMLSASVTLNASTAALGLGGGPLDALDGTFNASDVRLDAATAADLRTLSLAFNASSGTLSLPAIASGDMTLNASSLNLCVAPDANLLIYFDGTLSSHNFEEAGLLEDTDSWATAGDGTAGSVIHLIVTANVSSMTLSRAGGCP